MPNYIVHEISRIKTNFPLDTFSFFQVENEINDEDIIVNMVPEIESYEKGTKFGIYSYDEESDTICLKLSWRNVSGIISIKNLGNENPTIVEITPNFMRITKTTDTWCHVDTVISMLIQMKAIKKGYGFVHAASVAKENKAVVMPAWSDTGKTSTSWILAAKHGFEFMSDDVVLAGEDGTVLCFPQPSSIHMGTLRTISPVIPKRDSMSVKIREIAAMFAPSLIPAKVERDVWKKLPGIKVKEKAKMETIAMFQFGDPSIEEINEEKLFKRIWALSRVNVAWDFQTQIIMPYLYVNPEFKYEELEKKEYNNLKSFTEKAIKRYVLTGSHKTFKTQIFEVL